MAPDSRQRAAGRDQRTDDRRQTTAPRQRSGQAGSKQERSWRLEVRGNETVKADI
jgi:hypothetical protein